MKIAAHITSSHNTDPFQLTLNTSLLHTFTVFISILVCKLSAICLCVHHCWMFVFLFYNLCFWGTPDCTVVVFSLPSQCDHPAGIVVMKGKLHQQ